MPIDLGLQYQFFSDLSVLTQFQTVTDRQTDGHFNNG